MVRGSVSAGDEDRRGTDGLAGRYRLGRGRRHRPAAILVLLLTQVLLAGFYADLIPIFEGPDAEGHLRYIDQQQTDGLARAPLTAASAARSHELIQQPPLYYRIVAVLAWPAQAAPAVTRFQRNPYYPGLSHLVSIPARTAAPEVEWPARVAVWLSLLGAVLATTATYALARLLWPADASLALAAAAVLAFNPQFLHSAATVSNDALAAGMAALAVALAVRLAERGRSAKRLPSVLAKGLVLGLALGAAALTKYSGLLAMIPVALLLVSPTWRRPRLLLPALATAAGAWLALAGPWYLANLRESGQWVPTDLMHRLLPDLTRQSPVAWTAALRESLWLSHSYWGVFGYGFLAAPSYYTVIALLCLLSVAGIVAGVGRTLAHRSCGSAVRGFLTGPWLWMLIWLLAKAAAIITWIRTTQFANQGRLLFGAAPAVALLLVTGWRSLLPWQSRTVSRMVVVVMVSLAVGQLVTLMAAFRPAPALIEAHPQRPVQAIFAPGMHLLGLDVDRPTLEGSGVFGLRLYWTTGRAIESDAMTFVHLVDAAGNKLAAADQVPLAGRHPTRAWRPGEVFTERWRLPVAAVTEDTLVDVVIGAYGDEDPAARLPVKSGDGSPLGEELRLGPLLLRPAGAQDPACELAAPQAGVLRWRAGMRLDGARLGPDEDPAPLDVGLCWSSELAPQRNLSLFVQLLDASDKVLAQWDGAPMDGRRPVATWQRGTRLRDDIRLTPAPDAELDRWRRIILGWYDPLTGRREPLRDGRDHAILVERP